MATKDDMSKDEYIKALQEALQETLTRLVEVIERDREAASIHRVRVTHDVDIAESLLQDTEFPFRAAWRHSR